MSEDKKEYDYIVERVEVHDGSYIVAVFKDEDLAIQYVRDSDKNSKDITRTFFDYTKYEVCTE